MANKPEPTTYRTVADVDAYFAEQLFTTDWTGASAGDKAKSLLMVTRRIDAIAYEGEKASLYEARASTTDELTEAQVAAANALQTRQFPRDDADDPESWKLSIIDATGGTFTLTLNGEETSAIAYDADAATIQAALIALTSVSAGDVVVTVNESGVDSAGPYDVTMAGDFVDVRYNTLTSDPSGLTGSGGETTQVIVLNDNIPDEVFYAACEEAILLIAGRDAQQEFRNLTLTSDGIGSTRFTADRTQMPPEHSSHFFTSPLAWKYLRQFTTDSNAFPVKRTS